MRPSLTRQEAQAALPLHQRHLDVLAAALHHLGERAQRQLQRVAPPRLRVVLLQELAAQE